MNQPSHNDDCQKGFIEKAVAAIEDLKGSRNFPGANPTPEYDAGLADAVQALKVLQQIDRLDQ